MGFEKERLFNLCKSVYGWDKEEEKLPKMLNSYILEKAEGDALLLHLCRMLLVAMLC